MHLITLGLLVVFGGITLAVRDPAFLMWKVSVLYIVVCPFVSFLLTIVLYVLLRTPLVFLNSS
jgi:intracellular septation protein